MIMHTCFMLRKICEKYIVLVGNCCMHDGHWQKRKQEQVGISGGGGGTPITYTGMWRQTGSWFWRSWFRTGYSFQRHVLERGIKNCGSRLYLLLKIVADYEQAFIWCISRINKKCLFKKTGLFQFTNFLARSIKNWPFSRTGYQF